MGIFKVAVRVVRMIAFQASVALMVVVKSFDHGTGCNNTTGYCGAIASTSSSEEQLGIPTVKSEANMRDNIIPCRYDHCPA